MITKGQLRKALEVKYSKILDVNATKGQIVAARKKAEEDSK